MSQISDFSDKVNAAFDKINKSHEGLAADVQSLKDEIAKLQASSGTITAEDQALLDGIETRVNDLAAKFDALDALTTPPTP